MAYEYYLQTAMELAVGASNSNFEKDVVYRKWASIHGGVYVPVSERTPPNPYLANVPNRDVETTSGLKLTLVNPAYMTRQVHELGLADYGLRGHITSLNPLRPENAPDEWERKALEEFNRGKDEVWSLEKINDKVYLRYMRPFLVDSSCLKCHAHQDYKVGDIRGGISVSFPWEKSEKSLKAYLLNSVGVFGLIWLVGIFGIFVGQRVLSSNLLSQQITQDALLKSENTLRTVTGSVPLGIGLMADRKFDWVNEAFAEMVGYTRNELVSRTMSILYKNDQNYEAEIERLHAKLVSDPYAEIETRFTCKDGKEMDVSLRLASTERGNPSGSVVFSVIDITQARKAARELEEQSFRMQRAELVARFGNWEFDIGSGKIRGSMGAKRIYGMDRDEIELEKVKDIPLPEYREMMDSALKEVIQNRKPYDIEFKAVRQSDQQIIDIHAIADFNPDTNTVWGVIQDITEQKQFEDALKKSEARYRFLTENIVDVIWQMSPDLVFSYVSPSVKSQLGYRPEEILGRTIFEFLTPDSRSHAQNAFNERMKSFRENSTLEGIVYELEFVRKDNSTIWTEITSNPSFDSDNNLLGFHGVSREITDRKRAEESLRKSESLFRSYVESAPLGIWETDGTGKLVSANKATTEITGYLHEQLIGMNMMDVCLPEHVHLAAERFTKLRTSENDAAEVQIVKADGTIIWELLNAVKLSEDRYLFFIQDVTEKKLAQEEVIEMERRLFHAQKLESLGVLSGGIAHDFNNLLAIIIGNLELATDKIDPSSRAMDNIEKAMSAAERSASLTKQMLAYSGKSVLDVTEINLTEIVKSQSTMLKAAVVKAANLELNLDENLPALRGDAAEIQQVIMNLITNASESLETGYGKVKLSTGLRYCDKELLSHSLLPEKPTPQNMVFIEVEDNGIGMDSKTLHRLFDPFYTTKFLGRGLGMSVVHGVVKGHRGAITVKSQPEKGTIVTVYFPVSESDMTSRGETVDRAQLIQVQKEVEQPVFGSVLIVDDEPLVLDFMVSAMTSFGLNPITAGNGKEAVEVFRNNIDKIQLVLLDLSMPEMDGAATFEQIKKLKPDAKIILCSGYSEEEMLSRFELSNHPAAFLKKPSKLKDLKSLVRGVLFND